MKKLFLAVTLIVTIATAALGAVSEDMNVYVRQDVFEARMEAFMAEIRFGNEQLRGDIKELNGRIDGLNGRIDGISGRMDGLEKRMSGLETTVYWILGLLSFVVAAIALTPLLKEIHKPQITLDDVRRLIEEHDIQLGRMGA